MKEEAGSPLPGAGLRPGRVTRVGDTVRRPAGPWTSSVQDVLRYLREQGIVIVPEPRGTDSSGREVLGFIEGRDQGWPFRPEILTDDGAFRLGELAERLRTALSRYPCPADARIREAHRHHAGRAVDQFPTLEVPRERGRRREVDARPLPRSAQPPVRGRDARGR